MTEFEKWNKIHRINDLRLGDEITAKHKEQERKKGWKAALEWVLKDCEYTDPFGQSNFNSDLIKEELQ